MAYTKRILYEPLRVFDSSTFSGSYQTFGSPLAHPCSIVKLVNNSTVIVTVSTDGTNDHDVAPFGSFFLYDITTNSPAEAGSDIFIAQGTQYYIKGSAGTGDVWLVVQYILTVKI